jgi:hypothetical protein
MVDLACRTLVEAPSAADHGPREAGGTARLTSFPELRPMPPQRDRRCFARLLLFQQSGVVGLEPPRSFSRARVRRSTISPR